MCHLHLTRKATMIIREVTCVLSDVIVRNQLLNSVHFAQKLDAG